jgi:GT2 family glycosyltransferase
MRDELVSFVVLAYNQQKFVAEAVRGALAQTYHPLEIVISDDCSTDGTFDVIKFRFNIATGFSGSVTPTLTLTEATRLALPTNILSSTPVGTRPTLVIP